MEKKILMTKCKECGFELFSLYERQLDSMLKSHLMTHTKKKKPKD